MKGGGGIGGGGSVGGYGEGWYWRCRMDEVCSIGRLQSWLGLSLHDRFLLSENEAFVF